MRQDANAFPSPFALNGDPLGRCVILLAVVWVVHGWQDAHDPAIEVRTPREPNDTPSRSDATAHGVQHIGAYDVLDAASDHAAFMQQAEPMVAVEKEESIATAHAHVAHLTIAARGGRTPKVILNVSRIIRVRHKETCGTALIVVVQVQQNLPPRRTSRSARAHIAGPLVGVVRSRWCEGIPAHVSTAELRQPSRATLRGPNKGKRQACLTVS